MEDRSEGSAMNCPKCDGHSLICDACERPPGCWQHCDDCGGDFCANPSRASIIRHSHDGGPMIEGGTCPQCLPERPTCWDKHACAGRLAHAK